MHATLVARASARRFEAAVGSLHVLRWDAPAERIAPRTAATAAAARDDDVPWLGALARQVAVGALDAGIARYVTHSCGARGALPFSL